MIELTTPRSADPAELYRWIMDFVQRFMAQQSQAQGASNGGGVLGVLSGAAVWWPLGEAPEGYLALAGQTLDQSSFPILYSIYGTLFNTGGEAAGTFRLPDMTGRFPKAGATGTGGESELTLGLEHLPDLTLDVTEVPHTHEFSGAPHTHGITDPQHSHGVDGNWLAESGSVDIAAGAVAAQLGTPGTILVSNAATGITVNNATAGGVNSEETTGLSVQLSGGGEAISIDPPWAGGLWIVRAE